MQLSTQFTSQLAFKSTKIKQNTLRQPRSQPTRLDIVARGGGGSFGGDFGRPQQQSGDGGRGGLILPGQSAGQPSNNPGRIVIPNQDSGFRPSGQGLAIPGQPPQVRNFRPPPGFMNKDNDTNTDNGLSEDEMMNKFRGRSAHWHELAKLLPALHAKGQTAEMVEEATGIERKVLSIWTNAVQIYDSLKASGEVAPEILSHFDRDDGEYLLYELRFLSIKQRTAAAHYIVESRFNQQECLVLARAIKEYERRDGSKEGFSESPADCLAYKHYRDALECRRKEDIQRCVKRGLAVVDTDSARAALEKLYEGEFLTGIGPSATLNVLRLTGDEVGYRPISVAGSYESVKPSAVRAAPKASCEGVFGNFTLPASGLALQWIALPPWSIVTLAMNPVALTVSDCAEVEDVRDAIMAKSQDKNDLKKVRGAGLVVVDVGKKVETVETEQYYLCEVGDTVKLIPGTKDVGDMSKIIGQVLFLCRPPGRENTTTSELLQL